MRRSLVRSPVAVILNWRWAKFRVLDTALVLGLPRDARQDEHTLSDR